MRVTILAVMAGGGLLAADPPAPAVAESADVKAVMETIQSMSGLLDNLDAVANQAAEGDTPKVDKQGRPMKNSIAIITAGAAAGASIGAATKKGTQAIVIGAIAGAAAGLIYDRMTAEKKKDAETPAEGAPAEVQNQNKKPETNKQTTKPVAAPLL